MSEDKAKRRLGPQHAWAYYHQGKSSSEGRLLGLNLGIKAAHPRWGGEWALWSF